MMQNYNGEEASGDAPQETPDDTGLNAPSIEGWSAIDFWTTCGANAIDIDVDQMATLQRYHDELLYWNAKVNMISRQDDDHIWDRHILHSLTLLKYVNFPRKARVLDVGTGGGLPGIPVKIARPDIRMFLADSIRKKVNLANMFAQHTALRNIDAINTRVEDLAKDEHYRASFDVIVSRAVARVDVLLDWVSPLLAPNGFCAFLKGGDLEDEIAEARKGRKGLTITSTPIDMFGAPWFKENDKCIVIVRQA